MSGIIARPGEEKGEADRSAELEDQADGRSRRALGNAYYELGELTRKIGSHPEALKVHRQALAVRRELAAEPDADVEVRLDVARHGQRHGVDASQPPVRSTY